MLVMRIYANSTPSKTFKNSIKFKNLKKIYKVNSVEKKCLKSKLMNHYHLSDFSLGISWIKFKKINCELKTKQVYFIRHSDRVVEIFIVV